MWDFVETFNAGKNESLWGFLLTRCIDRLVWAKQECLDLDGSQSDGPPPIPPPSSSSDWSQMSLWKMVVRGKIRPEDGQQKRTVQEKARRKDETGGDGESTEGRSSWRWGEEINTKKWRTENCRGWQKERMRVGKWKERVRAGYTLREKRQIQLSIQFNSTLFI